MNDDRAFNALAGWVLLFFTALMVWATISQLYSGDPYTFVVPAFLAGLTLTGSALCFRDAR